MSPSTTSPASTGTTQTSQTKHMPLYATSSSGPTQTSQTKHVSPSTTSPTPQQSCSVIASQAVMEDSRQSQLSEREQSDPEKVNNDDEESSPAVVSAPNTPVLRKVGEKTPPNTLKRDRPQSSCKSWYSQYSQGFLSKTIDTPDIELPPLGDEEDDETDSDRSPNNERKVKE